MASPGNGQPTPAHRGDKSRDVLQFREAALHENPANRYAGDQQQQVARGVGETVHIGQRRVR